MWLDSIRDRERNEQHHTSTIVRHTSIVRSARHDHDDHDDDDDDDGDYI